MGAKPRKKAIKRTKETVDASADYAKTMRMLLKQHKVPKEHWQKCLDGDLEDYPNADADQDLHWFVGWFHGVAVALNCELEDLVTL